MHNLSKHKFKVKLHNVLLQILTETDDYIELTDLIMKMKMSQKQLASIIFPYILLVLFIYYSIVAT